MSKFLDTIVDSLRDLLASSIKSLPGLLAAVVVLFLTRYLAKISERIAIKFGKRALRSSSLQLLLSKSSYVFAWVCGVLFACVIAFPGLSLGDIVATLGLSSVAIGFAFQDIFKNFLAGIILLLQEPFRINDQIIIGNYEGTVEEIGIRATKIKTYKGERIILPNSTVFTSAVQVRTAFDRRRTDLAVGVDYKASLPDALKILQQTIVSIEGVLDNPAPEVDIVGFGESSVDFLVRYWTQSQQQMARRIQTQAIVAIKKALDRANINIPYPICTIHLPDRDSLSVSGNNRDGV
jgi:small conductance mechanosensitive channel